MEISVLSGCSWSGGKDSCFALMQAIKSGYKPAALLNILNEGGMISRSHGIPYDILEAQANSAGLPIHLISSSWNEYESKFVAALLHLKQHYGIANMVFGDIDLQEHLDWENKVCTRAGLNAVLPLWKQDRKDLVLQMLQSGIETMIVSCNTLLGENFLGKILNDQTISELEMKGVDVCGENGEFHTLVLNSPLFAHRIEVENKAKLLHENYWFTELSLKEN